MEIKRELPELSKALLAKQELSTIDLKTLDTKLLLNFAADKSAELRNMNLKPKISNDRLNLIR